MQFDLIPAHLSRVLFIFTFDCHRINRVNKNIEWIRKRILLRSKHNFPRLIEFAKYSERVVWELQGPPSNVLFHFFEFLIAQVFLHRNISCGKNIVHRGLQGGHQSGVAKIYFERCLQKNFNCGQDTNDKDIFFLQNKFQII